MSGDFVIFRRYLYAHRIFLAWVHRDVAQRAHIFYVRC